MINRLLVSLRLLFANRANAVRHLASNGQYGGYRFIRRISTDKRPCVDRSDQLPDRVIRSPQQLVDYPLSSRSKQMNLNGVLAELTSERDRLNAAIAALKMVNGTYEKSSGRRRLSAAARQRISRAQKARWAAQKRHLKSASKPRTPKRRSRISAAGRKRLSDMMKARWAARKKAGKAA
jgi:hypothetical protein